MSQDLIRFATDAPHRLLMKWEHYFSIYDRHFNRFRGKPVRILEIGVYKGGGLDLWRDYFGPDATITGIDIFDAAKELESPGTDIIICDQSNTANLERIFSKREPYDIIIDDGGHTMTQQIGSLKGLFPLLAPNGVYLIEDMHTAYWSKFEGGLRNPSSSIEFIKKLIDYVNIDHFREPDMQQLYGPLKKSLKEQLISCSFYDSICVLEKGDKTPKRANHYHGNGRVEIAGTSNEIYS